MLVYELNDVVSAAVAATPHPRMLRRLLALRGDDPRAWSRLVVLIATHGDDVHLRLRRLGLPAASPLAGVVAEQGFHTVHSAAVAASAVFLWGHPTHVLDRVEHWRHAVAAGLAAATLAGTRGEWADEAFAAGMLHELGRLLLDLHAPDALREAARTGRTASRLRERETALLGYDERVVADRALAALDLPAWVRCVAAGDGACPSGEAAHSGHESLRRLAAAACDAVSDLGYGDGLALEPAPGARAPEALAVGEAILAAGGRRRFDDLVRRMLLATLLEP